MKNVLINVNKFIFLFDFLVLHMDNDCETHLILGLPFLTTSTLLIDIQEGELTLRLNDEQVFKMSKRDTSSPNVNSFSNVLKDYVLENSCTP